jgi:hypothetical protein
MLVDSWANRLHEVAREGGTRRAISHAYRDLPDTDREHAVVASLEFITYHELGHALIDLLGLPITGREEDAADQLSTYLLLTAGDEVSAVTAWQGAESLRALQGRISELALADEHSLGQQRFYNVLCWIYGSDPERFGTRMKEAGLPQQRATQCPHEFDVMKRAWDALLAPTVRPADFTAFAGRVTSLQVFDASHAQGDDSKIGTEFVRSNLTRVGLVFRVAFPPPPEPMEATVTCSYLAPNGVILDSVTVP